jgi:hypothetical protein
MSRIRDLPKGFLSLIFMPKGKNCVNFLYELGYVLPAPSVRRPGGQCKVTSFFFTSNNQMARSHHSDPASSSIPRGNQVCIDVTRFDIKLAQSHSTQFCRPSPIPRAAPTVPCIPDATQKEITHIAVCPLLPARYADRTTIQGEET